MQNWKKKIMILGLSVSLVAGGLYGCGNTDTEETTEKTEGTSGESEETVEKAEGSSQEKIEKPDEKILALLNEKPRVINVGAAGFNDSVSDFGGRSVVVRAVPADIVPEDVEDLLLDVAQRLCANPKETVSGKTEWVLHSVACRAAVKGGEKNSRAQLIRLAQDVLDGKIPPYCPHGRPVVLKITLKELEKQFGRQG